MQKRSSEEGVISELHFSRRGTFGQHDENTHVVEGDVEESTLPIVGLS